MAINSKVEICNLALGHLGNQSTVENIDTPTEKKEIVFAQWYDITRQHALKLAMPNFALARKYVSQTVIVTDFGYENVFEYPVDCLKFLGIGDIELKEKVDYTVEGNKIYTYDAYDTGLPIRYIKDIEDVSTFSPEFKLYLSWMLAGNVALQITQDINKSKIIQSLAAAKALELSGMNAQENPPIRKSTSRFKGARYFGTYASASKR